MTEKFSNTFLRYYTEKNTNMSAFVKQERALALMGNCKSKVLGESSGKASG